MTFAFFLESVGGGEWLVLLAVILIVVGPKNLPSAARKIGQLMSQLRRAADEFKRQLMTMDQDIQKTVEDVKQSYMDVGQEVNDTVTEDGTSVAQTDSASSDAADTPPYDEDSDRAMWESYGRDYDPEGIYGYDGDDSDSETPADDPPPAAPAETAAVETAAAPVQPVADSAAAPSGPSPEVAT